MLNYCYIVEAGRLAKALAARGLALPIGYLHSDKKGRRIVGEEFCLPWPISGLPQEVADSVLHGSQRSFARRLTSWSPPDEGSVAAQSVTPITAEAYQSVHLRDYVKGRGQ
jgi:hypothetical protein